MRLGNSAVNGHGIPNNIGQNMKLYLRYMGNDKVSKIMYNLISRNKVDFRLKMNTKYLYLNS